MDKTGGLEEKEEVPIVPAGGEGGWRADLVVSKAVRKMDRTGGLEEEEEVSIVPAAGEGGWRAVLERRLPAARWARLYTRTAAAADAVAGVTLGLTLVPQSIAYAALADLPVQYGLYSAFAGTLVYAVLGTVREASIGPTSLSALLTLQATRGLPPAAAALLALLAGALVLLMGLLRLGFLVDLISPSVTSGFTSATAMIIVCAQLKGLLGLSFTAETPLDNFRLIAERWRLVRASDASLAASCCAALLLLRKLKDLPISPKRRKLKKTLWLISIARNALVVLAASVLAYCTYDAKQPLFQLSGKVEPGLPKFGLPAFSMRVGNETLGFLELTHRLGHHVLLLPFVMVLANIAIAKAFAEGGRVDATQEMVALGVCNVLGSMVSALPACGAFTRSAVSHASGVHSPAAGLYSGVITLLALQYLTEYFFYIPKACLAAVLICAVIFMIDFGIVVRLWSTERAEALVTAGTWAACVCGGVLGAVLGGALASLAALLRALLPGAVLARRGRAVLLRPRRALVFVNAEREAERVRAALAAHDLRVLLVDCGALVLLDHAARRTLERLIEESEERGHGVIFFNANPEVLDDLRRVSGLDGRALSVTSPSGALLEFPALGASYKARAAPPALPTGSSQPTPSGTELAVLLDKSEYAMEEV